MTRVSGVHIIKSPCCGVQMHTSAYASINFTATEYWTDGHTEGSLAPQGEGLRRCLCVGTTMTTATVVSAMCHLRSAMPGRTTPFWPRDTICTCVHAP